MNDPDSASISGSTLIAKMKKELSEIRISLLEAATDYLTSMTELTEYEDNKNDSQNATAPSSEHKAQANNCDTQDITE
ncbi:hypothetical protein GCM10023116_34200 [Kistimonas scapharcae]|uniref:Uncharacterized protein n=1 Tax=Kistimonas scapharcae TaxID=1036133 RepID=A0ABP8V849_9GAMM